jgi:general secretion pathway protein A
MYLTFYNLKEQPFRLTPDPRFLHLAEPHRAALHLVLQGVLLRKGFLVLGGPVGTGKSTILHTALHLISKKLVVKSRLASALIVNPMLTRDEFFEALLDEFEISCDSTSKPRRLEALLKMLLEIHRQGGVSVLFIDEAHLLTVELLEEIRLLSNVDTYDGKLLQIVLCGQPELFAMLHRPEMRALQQRIAASYQLRPLNLPETRLYIAERLCAAGLHGAAPFSGPAIEKIHHFTEGVPRLINLLCDGCLLIGFETQRKVVEIDIVDEAAANLGLTLSSPSLMGPTVVAAPRRAANGTKSQAQDSSVRNGAVVNQEATPGASPRSSIPATPPADGSGSLSTLEILSNALRQGRAAARE